MMYQNSPRQTPPKRASKAQDPRSQERKTYARRARRRQRRSLLPPLPRLQMPKMRWGCLLLLLPLGCIGFILAVYLVFPMRTNVLVLGIDYVDPGSSVARSDTIMMLTYDPYQPYVGLLSIPRDLWVTIPGLGENRINTAHFFAESMLPGSGPVLAMETIRANFGVRPHYYLRVRFEAFRDIVDALGGVVIDLPEPMAGYEAGRYRLTGRKALAFVRNRQNTDDFFRMAQGQFMVKAIFRNMLNPLKWPRIPGVIRAVLRSIDTNLPAWAWPRLAFALLRVGPNGIDNRIITREMVIPFTTNEGASVLAPIWDLINPMVKEMFAR